MHKVETRHTRKHVERAVDGEGHNRQADFIGQLERAFLEAPHVSCKVARAFGEDHERCAVA